MAGQISAILKGLDYQHLVSWYHILSLKKNKSDVTETTLENPEAGYADDLTVEHSNGAIDFYQIKYHVSGGHYSISDLIKSGESKSLMEKFWITWNKLIRVYSKDKIRLILYSNWGNHPDDKILLCIDNENDQLNHSFFSASIDSDCGKQKEIWKKAHDADDASFIEFSKAISFQLGRNSTAEIKKMVADRMELCRLQYDENAMLIAVGIVKNWIKEKKKRIILSDLNEELAKHNLYLPENTEKAAIVYLTTIKERKFDLPPDYSIDWRNHFIDTGGLGGHELTYGLNWNKVLLPELRKLEEKINTEITPTVIRARGFARLSAWFALGFTFSEVSGYTIEVNQQAELWRTDEQKDSKIKIISENGAGEILTSGNNIVAAGISITGSLEADVRKYVIQRGDVDALLLLRPEGELGPSCFKNAADVKSFANQVKTLLREFVRHHSAKKLLLFYFGPLSGACFLGHQLNAVCKEIQIMENSAGGSYQESFTLS